MKIFELTKYLEVWAPTEIAWDKDNVGLQIGSLSKEFSNILLCLEATEAVIKEAIKKKCNLIFSHHPLIFNPIKKIDTHQDKTSRLIELLIKNNITLISYHTNLDFTKNGVSFQLARKLNLQKITFLQKQKSNQYKLVVFIPEENIEQVSNAMFDAGAGIIGEYSKCSYKTDGEGTFQGSMDTNPAIGSKMNFEKVNEYRLEVLVNKWNLKNVLNALIKTHPYEEPAYDIYPLENENINYGFGAIGELSKPMQQDEFLNFAARQIGNRNLKYVPGKSKTIKRVAVCGGSGNELLGRAISSSADAFITADIKYHSFFDAEGKILLIDAGHYETEIHILPEIKTRISLLLNEKKLTNKIFIFNKTTNPVKFLQEKRR